MARAALWWSARSPRRPWGVPDGPTGEGLTCPGPALELHMIQSPKRLVAFWMTDEAKFIRRAEVGEA